MRARVGRKSVTSVLVTGVLLAGCASASPPTEPTGATTSSAAPNQADDGTFTGELFTMVVPAGFELDPVTMGPGVQTYSWTPPADAQSGVTLTASEGSTADLFAQEGVDTFEEWFAAREDFVLKTWRGNSYVGMTAVSGADRAVEIGRRPETESEGLLRQIVAFTGDRFAEVTIESVPTRAATGHSFPRLFDTFYLL